MDSVKNLFSDNIGSTYPGTTNTTIYGSVGWASDPTVNGPSVPFDALLFKQGVTPSLTNAEIVRVSAFTSTQSTFTNLWSTTYTVARAQYGTTAQNINASGWILSQVVTANNLKQLQAYSGQITSSTRTITLPVGNTQNSLTAQSWLCSSDTGAIFTTNNSNRSLSVSPGTEGVLRSVYFSTTLGATGASGSYSITVGLTTGMSVGVNIVVGTEATKTITGINGTTVWLSSALGATQANGSTVTSVADTQITISPNSSALNKVTGLTKTLPTSTTWASVSTNGSGTWWATQTGNTNANAYSTDNGATWAAGATFAVAGTYGAITYGNGRWIAIGATSNTTQIFVNGGTQWTTGGTMPTSNQWNSVCWGTVGGANGTFVAVQTAGSTQPAYSTDNGATWASATGVNASQSCVAWGNGIFMAVQGNGSGIWTSPTGTQWTNQGASNIAANYRSVVYGNGRWVVTTGNAAASQRVLVSFDNGTNWVASSFPANSAGTSTAIAFGNGMFVMGVSVSPFLYYSYDAFNWFPVIMNNVAAINQSTYYNGVAYGNGYWNLVYNASGNSAGNFPVPAKYPVNYTIVPLTYNSAG